MNKSQLDSLKATAKGFAGSSTETSAHIVLWIHVAGADPEEPPLLDYTFSTVNIDAFDTAYIDGDKLYYIEDDAHEWCWVRVDNIGDVMMDVQRRVQEPYDAVIFVVKPDGTTERFIYNEEGSSDWDQMLKALEPSQNDFGQLTS